MWARAEKNRHPNVAKIILNEKIIQTAEGGLAVDPLDMLVYMLHPSVQAKRESAIDAIYDNLPQIQRADVRIWNAYLQFWQEQYPLPTQAFLDVMKMAYFPNVNDADAVDAFNGKPIDTAAAFTISDD